MNSDATLLQCVHTALFCVNLITSAYLVLKFQARTLFLLSEERKWGISAFLLFCGIAASLIDISSDPFELKGVAWIQALALLVIASMNVALLWLLCVPQRPSDGLLKGYLLYRPSFVTVHYHDVGVQEVHLHRQYQLWDHFLNENPTSYYLWYVYAVAILKGTWDLRLLPVDLPETHASQSEFPGFYVGVLALQNPSDLRKWYEAFRERTIAQIPRVTEIPIWKFPPKAIQNPTHNERRQEARHLVQKIQNVLPDATCLTPIV